MDPVTCEHGTWRSQSGRRSPGAAWATTPCAVVSAIGGYDLQETEADYAAVVRAATWLHAIGVSVWDWPTTPPSAWPPLQGYDVAGC